MLHLSVGGETPHQDAQLNGLFEGGEMRMEMLRQLYA